MDEEKKDNFEEQVTFELNEEKQENVECEAIKEETPTKKVFPTIIIFIVAFAALVVFTIIVLAFTGVFTHDHTFSEWIEVEAPKCEIAGRMERTCKCGETETREIHAIGHSDVEWITDSIATCTENGSKSEICTVCKKILKTTSITKTGHNYGMWVITVNPTCTKEGRQERVCSCGEKETVVLDKDKSHKELQDKIYSISVESTYEDMYSLYQEVLDHINSKNCSFTLSMYYLLENMLYGCWEDANGNYISYTYVYEDYNNTVGSTWYGTNLMTSKISGNSYYYYTDTRNEKLVIGYEDKLTEEQTDNFVISFFEKSITVENLNDNKTYYLSMLNDYDKVQKGNARLAYIYIAKKILSFKYPSSVKVTSCYVDYEDKIVYVTIQASNAYGGIVNTDYKLYESGGKYYLTEFNHSYSTNIDLQELNDKLQEYVSMGG